MTDVLLLLAMTLASKEELTAVYMSQAPSPIRAYYRKLVKQLAYGALTD